MGQVYAVLYEMLTGKRVFAVGDVSETLAYVITKDVDWAALPEGTSTALRRVLGRCLERDPKRRLLDIGDAWLELEDPQVSPTTERGDTVAPRLQVWQRPVAAVVSAVALVVLGGLAVWVRSRSPCFSCLAPFWIPCVRREMAGAVWTPPLRLRRLHTLRCIIGKRILSAQRKGPAGICTRRAFSSKLLDSDSLLLVHVAHTAHVRRATRGLALLFGELRDQHFSRQQQ